MNKCLNFFWYARNQRRIKMMRTVAVLTKCLTILQPQDHREVVGEHQVFSVYILLTSFMCGEVRVCGTMGRMNWVHPKYMEELITTAFCDLSPRKEMNSSADMRSAPVLVYSRAIYFIGENINMHVSHFVSFVLGQW